MERVPYKLFFSKINHINQTFIEFFSYLMNYFSYKVKITFLEQQNNILRDLALITLQYF